MATVSGTLSATGFSPSFAPATGRAHVTVSGRFSGAAQLVRSLDNGATWQAAASQGSIATTGSGRGDADINDPTAGVFYAIEALISRGSVNFTLTDIAQTTVTVAAGRTLVANGQTYSAGQQVTVDESDADALVAGGGVLRNYVPGVVAAPVTPAAPAVAAPTVTTSPSLSTSSPQVGTTITATAGTYTGSPNVTRQWFYGDTGAAISGATGLSYTPVSADVSHPLKYIETATNSGGSVAGSTPATAAVIAAASSVPANALLFGGQPLLFGGQNLLY